MAASESPSFADSLILVDGSALAYRAHFAMARSSLSSPKGLPTGAVFGFVAELRRLAAKCSPKAAAVVFDTPEPTFRHKLYRDYKATRERMPPELVEQLPWIKRGAEVLGFRVLEKPGYEADDLIGTLAIQSAQAGTPVYIVTADKDFMQLVDAQIRLYGLPRSEEPPRIIGRSEVIEAWGVPPERIIDLLALMGDASDNIPGIPGIGEKGAKKLLASGRDLEGLLIDPGEDISPKVRSALREHAESGRLSRELATIDTRVPLDLSLEELQYAGPRAELAAALFRELGFRTFAQEMAAKSQVKVARNYRILRTQAELQTLLERLQSAELVAVDTETTGLDPRRAQLVGISFSTAENDADYVPLLGLGAPTWDELRGPAGALATLRPFLEDATPRKCGQNVKYDRAVFETAGVALRGIRTDTLIASFLLEAHERERNLDALALRHFGHVKIKTEEIIGKGKSEITMDAVPVEAVGEYAAEDADYTRRLAAKFLPTLEEEGLLPLHDDVELPLIAVIQSMEAAGVRVDRDILRKMAKELAREIGELETKITAAAGCTFNPSSPKQLGEVLFDRLEIHKQHGKKPRQTKTGYATGQEILEEYEDHPVVALVMEHRSKSKLLSTYVEPLPDLVDEDTGRIHTSFHQTGAATGRISSTDPNLQNIPIRTPTGRRIREAFLPSSDHHVLLSADYSQIELRIMAHLSEDENLIAAFRAGADIHRDTAARVFGVAPEAVDATMRSRAKAINFGILYGMGPQRLSRETALSLDEAKDFIERYFAAFPRIRSFLDNLKQKARERGFAETILGRRRRLPDLMSSNRMLLVAAENMAVNTPIQGSAADILKVAMVRVHSRLQQDQLRSRMILTVHDELVFDVPEVELAAVSALVRAEMEGAYPLRVPLKVEAGSGRNWLEAH